MAVTAAHPVQVTEQYMKGFRVGHHSCDRMRIVYIADTGREGDFDWMINSRLHRVHAGDFVLFNFADLRMPLLKKRGEHVRIQVLTFHPEIAAEGAALLDIYYSFAVNPVLSKEIAAPLLPLFQRITAECAHADPLSKEAAISALRLFLIDLLRLTQATSPPNVVLDRTTLKHMQLLGDVTSYLRQSLTQPLSIRQTAEQFGISESSLSKLFKRLLGMSFPEYVRQLRVNRVIDILCDGKTSVLEASLEAGFGSISGFYKAFTAVTGTTPNKFLSFSKNAEK